MDTVRFGIIGMGNIGAVHAENLLGGRVARGELAAMASSSPDKREVWRQRGVQVFADLGQLLQSRTVDAVIIATPHWQHPELGLAAFAAGAHVLMEKPIAAHKADAEKLLAAHRANPQIMFGCMYQMRVEPRFQKIRALIQAGELGQLVRVNWINTDWFRTAAYYASGGWRATWAEEGGGVLLNQCLHNLDTLQWICGMPACVRGFCQLGRFHDIQTEDSVTAYLEWANGATGVFVSSTGEAPGTNRLEIAGTLGKLVLENDRLVVTRNETDMIGFSQAATQGFVKPETRTEEIVLEKSAHPHAAITQNFVNAILDGEPLIAPGDEGVHALELANAITLSSLQNETVALPMDGSRWEKKLRELMAQSAAQQ